MQGNMTRAAETILTISGVDPKKCIKCGKCSASCPAFDEMDIHPHQVVAMVQDGNVAPLLKSESLWKCVSCFACVERCPRNVEPARLIEAARLTVIRKQCGNRFRPEDVPPLVDERIPQQAITAAFHKFAK